MRLAEYLTCCPKQDFSDGNARIRNWDWVPNYHGEWAGWAREAWGEEKRNRQVAYDRIMNCYNHRQEELDLSHLGLSCLPILPSFVKIFNASHNKLTGLPFPYPVQMVKIDLSYNEIEKLPRKLLLQVQELILIGNPLSKKFIKSLHFDFMDNVKFEDNISVPHYPSQPIFKAYKSWLSLQVSQLCSKKRLKIDEPGD